MGSVLLFSQSIYVVIILKNKTIKFINLFCNIFIFCKVTADNFNSKIRTADDILAQVHAARCEFRADVFLLISYYSGVLTLCKLCHFVEILGINMLLKHLRHA